MRIIIKKLLTFFSAFALLFFVANRIFFFKSGFLERTAAKITYPFLYCAHSVSEYFHEKTAQKERYEDIVKRYNELQASHEDLIAEYIKLKTSINYEKLSNDLVDFQQRYELEDKISAKILVKHIDDSEHFFLINRGTRDGIRKNMVALYKFQIVGRISEVFDQYSKVVLITDQNCKIGAYTANTNANGIVQGINKVGVCSLNYVSHLEDIENDDLILSNGQGLVFPEGFCLGKVVNHSLQEKALYHEITIQPLIDLKQLKFCMIVDQTKIKLF